MTNRHTTSRTRRWTDKELESLPEDGYKYELLDGSLIKSLGGARHGAIAARLGALLLKFVDQHKLGDVYASRTGFRLAPDLLLSPDISFATNARLKKILIAPDKFLQGAPDLAIEVLSPGDRLQQVHRKLNRYFEHGV